MLLVGCLLLTVQLQMPLQEAQEAQAAQSKA